MQKAPVMKGSGLKPLEESKSGDQPVHVFGSNLASRVVTGDTEETPAISFGAIQESKKEDDIDTIRKRKFDAITGEEDEETVFQGDFKLYAWDLASSNWVEKGRGQLRLNDSLNQEEKRSRIIMRVGGTLKVALNVAIKHSNFKVISNSKTCIRFTDSQTLWAARGSNASQLRDLIDQRIEIAAEMTTEAATKKPKNDQKDANQDHPPAESASEQESDQKIVRPDQSKDETANVEQSTNQNDSTQDQSDTSEESETNQKHTKQGDLDVDTDAKEDRNDLEGAEHDQQKAANATKQKATEHVDGKPHQLGSQEEKTDEFSKANDNSS